eukprot:7734458-Pyramimonas_sp.AAC.1
MDRQNRHAAPADPVPDRSRQVEPRRAPTHQRRAAVVVDHLPSPLSQASTAHTSQTMSSEA